MAPPKYTQNILNTIPSKVIELTLQLIVGNGQVGAITLKQIEQIAT